MRVSEKSSSRPELGRWRTATDLPLVVLAVGSLPILLLELRRSRLQRSDQLIIDAVNVVVLVAFAVDYLVELILVKDRRRYVREEWTSLLIVLAQAVALMPLLAPLGAIRMLRAGRALRVLALMARAAAIGGSAAASGRSLLRQHAGKLGLGVGGFTWVMSAAAFTIAESGSGVHSFVDGLWWSAATITTVGYGDVYPVTPVGRLIGGFTMLIGISTFALVTASVARFLVRDD